MEGTVEILSLVPINPTSHLYGLRTGPLSEYLFCWLSQWNKYGLKFDGNDEIVISYIPGLEYMEIHHLKDQ